ncbi:MAG TPA: MBL fold metallo-hydrolase [Candidatus Paceibacterota bacterium]|nr:MBL fold metallo-hydrolase [Candidatus Paceibacterota bacterium]
MKITKFGHCCLLLEVSGTKIVTDPGSFTTEQNNIEGINVILITHEHQDHFHVESVKEMLAKNPNATVVTNGAVGALLEKEGIKSTRVSDGEHAEVAGVKIEGFGKDHAPIYGEMGLVENTAYMVADKFYFPGDNFHVCGKPVDVLALPVAGPWMKMSHAIDFAKEVKARTAFGVHDGMIMPFFRGFVGNALKMFVPDTEYVSIADGESREF